MQMKPYFLKQGVFNFVDDSLSCPSPYVVATDVISLHVNHYFLRWKQQDYLILSALLFSFSMDVLHLVDDCQTLHFVWHTLEPTLVSPSNSHIIQLHGSFQDL